MKGNQELAGRVALVTGAARNIGRAISVDLAEAGAAVAINVRSDMSGAKEGVRQIEAAGGKAIAIAADVSDEQSVSELIARVIAEFGRLDVLVNNASMRIETPIERMSYAEWRSVTSVILDGPFLCARAAIPHLAKSPAGAIINIGGRTGHTGAAHRAHVVSAKAGLVGLTKALAHELAPEGITVNLVSPGGINTVRGASAIGESPNAGRVPMVGRRGEPEDIAAMVRFLAGPNSRYMTGQTVHLSGGSHMP